MTWQKIELSGAQVLAERIEAEGIATPEEVELIADILGYYLDDEQDDDEQEEDPEE